MRISCRTPLTCATSTIGRGDSLAADVVPLAKTGDAEKRMLVVEYGLKVKTEKAHGVAADLEAS